VDALFDAAAEVHGHRVLGTTDLPRVAEAQPLVGALDLEAVLEVLLENAELVANAIPVAGDAERGHRVEEARRETTEAAVAEAGVGLLLDDVGEIEARVTEQLAHAIVHAERAEVVHERAPEKKL